MSDNINSMDVKQLRNEVQLLRDELAIMKRKYEDILYNLDNENFSSRIVKEKGDMKTAIEVNAEGIKTKVSNEEFQSAMTQTAEKIETEVKSLDEKLSSEISQTADEIYAEVSILDDSIAEISIKADRISTKVTDIEDGNFGGYTLFEQTNDTFYFDGEKAVFTGVIYLANDYKYNAFSIFLNEGIYYDSFHIWGCDEYYSEIPIIIGGSSGEGVYIGDFSDSSRIATRGWVKEQMRQTSV